ncbi:MAG: 6-phospho-3-hexuloisomerase [Candidatus Helarchaeota archaeon]
MRFKDTMEEIANNISKIKEEISEEILINFVNRIYTARKIFIYGAGRSGFIGRAFAQRLMHLGYNSVFIGDSITPQFIANDLLILISGSGETTSTVALAKKGKQLKGQIVLITSHPDSTIGKIADLIINIKSKSKSDLQKEKNTLAPYTSLFDITTLAFFDSIARVIMDEKNITELDIEKRHATLE